TRCALHLQPGLRALRRQSRDRHGRPRRPAHRSRSGQAMTDAAEPYESVAPSAEPRPAPAFERSISPIAGRLGSGLAGKGVVVAALVAGCGVFVAATWGHDKPKAEPRHDEPARQVVPFEPAIKSPPPTLAAPGPNAPTLGPTQTGGAVPALQPTAGGPASAA